MSRSFSRLAFSTILLLAGFAFVIPRAEAYSIFNEPVLVESRNGQARAGTLIAAGLSAASVNESEGGNQLSAGLNVYIPGQITYSEPGVPSVLFDLIVPGFNPSTGASGLLLEGMAFKNIKSVTFTNPALGGPTTYDATALINQNPALDRLVFYVTFAPPGIVQGSTGAYVSGTEQMTAFSNVSFGAISNYVVVDLENDGFNEIVFSYTTPVSFPNFPIVYVSVMEHTGAIRTGFPLATNAFPGFFGISVANIDVTPEQEIVLHYQSQVSFAFEIRTLRFDGTAKFTVQNEGLSAAGSVPSAGSVQDSLPLADVTGDGAREIVVTGREGFTNTFFVNVIDGNGNNVAGYPQLNVAPISAFAGPVGIAVANVDTDPADEIVSLVPIGYPGTIVADNRIFIFDTGTQTLQSTIVLPQTSGGIPNASGPRLLQMDADSAYEIAVALFPTVTPAPGGIVAVYNSDGTLLNGSWPVTVPNAVTLSAADADNDGSNEIVAAGISLPGGATPPSVPIRIFRADGTTLPGFGLPGYPAVVGDGVRIADIDLDANFELVVANQNGISGISVTNGSLTYPIGFPVIAGGVSVQDTAGPTVADIDGDGILEVVASRNVGILPSTSTGTFFVYKIAYYAGADPNPSLLPWPTRLANPESNPVLP